MVQEQQPQGSQETTLAPSTEGQEGQTSAPEVQPSQPPNYLEMPEVRATIEEAEQRGFRKGQGERDRYVAQAVKNYQRQGMAKQLEKLRQDDPEEFAKVMENPENRAAWAEHLPKPEEEAIAAGAYRVFRYLVATHAGDPDLKDAPPEFKTKLQALWAQGPDKVIDAIVDYKASKLAEKKSKDAAPVIAKAMVEDTLARQRSHVPQPETGGGVATTAASVAAQRHEIIEAMNTGKMTKAQALARLNALGG